MDKDFYSTSIQSEYLKSSKLRYQETVCWVEDGRYGEVHDAMLFAKKDYDLDCQLKGQKWKHKEEVRQFKMLSSPLEGESPPGQPNFLTCG